MAAGGEVRLTFAVVAPLPQARRGECSVLYYDLRGPSVHFEERGNEVVEANTDSFKRTSVDRLEPMGGLEARRHGATRGFTRDTIDDVNALVGHGGMRGSWMRWM